MSAAYTNSYKKEGLIFKENPPASRMPNRAIITNLPDEQVCDNSIKTSKYTVVSFVPKNLMVQFSKVANIYFLIIGIMQMMPEISVSGGFPVIFIPLSIVVGVSAMKDFLEDLKRKKSDAAINSMPANLVGPGGTHVVMWKDLRIGNIVKVEKDQQFPADMILLATSEPNQNCFIETKNLDGETNLKSKKVKPEISRIFAPAVPSNLHNISQEFKYERPNPFIHTFTGSIGNAPLDNNNIVLRGCSLKITHWVYGLVIYTGVDSKIMLNSNKTRQKKSRLEFKMGIIVAVVFLVQMALTFLCAFMSTVMSRDTINLHEWIDFTATNELISKWGSWVLLFTNFVPISLIVSLEMVKYIQGINITNSHFKTAAPATVTVQTSTLNEELGQIQHLFSDKTGTLTQNYMSFKYMVAGLKTYGYGHDRQNIPSDISNVDFHDGELMKRLKSEPVTPASNSDLFDLLLALSICHDVIIERDDMGNAKFNASSPDELAFINMARYCGWEYLGIDANNIVSVRYAGQVIRHKLLHVIEFNSDRKRMSIIIEKVLEDGQEASSVIVLCKGADNMIYERLKNPKEEENKKLEIVRKNVEEWSVEGLRTLVFGKREVNKEDYNKWAKMYAYSLSQLNQIEKKEKQEMERIKQEIIQSDKMARQSRTLEEKEKPFLNNLGRFIINDFSSEKIGVESPTELINKLLNDASMLTESQKKFLERHLSDMGSKDASNSTTKELEEIIEKGLVLIGATAIEDKLQDNVRLTIMRLREAGVKVWMLTGDKKETAINIGKSCGIIAEDMAVLKWSGLIENVLEERNRLPDGRECCLVVTGDDLLKATDEIRLLRLVHSCKSIIACRVTPKQKQDLVWLMRKNRQTTLGIGDGANDVNMINTAHVGVGIKGVEGAQAALCSDYAISEFQIIGELMLYHGRECYRKNSQLILFNFYKNLLLVLPQLWYGFSSYFSSANIYDPWIYQLYNVIYTSLPIAIFAIYDMRYTRDQSLSDPTLYREGLTNQLFNFRRVAIWFVLPILFSFFLSTFTFLGTELTISSEGVMFDMVSSGMSIFAQCVIICNLRVLVISYKFSLGLVGSVVMGILMFWITMGIASSMNPASEVVNLTSLQMGCAEYWMLIVQNVSIVVLIELGLGQWRALDEQRLRGRKNSLDEIEMPIMEIPISHE